MQEYNNNVHNLNYYDPSSSSSFFFPTGGDWGFSFNILAPHQKLTEKLNSGPSPSESMVSVVDRTEVSKDNSKQR